MQISVFETRLALGSDTTLMLVGDQNDQARLDNLMRKLWHYVFSFEKRFSRFLPNSELTYFNKNAGSKQPISPEFEAILREAKRLSDLTQGLFNPFMLPALQRAGYRQSMVPGYKTDSQLDYSGRHVSTPEFLKIESGWARIPHNTAIELGGCGKGYLADRLAEICQRDFVNGYWLSIGGDIVGQGVDQYGRAWTVDIKPDPKSNRPAKWQYLPSTDRFAIATSSTMLRQGKKAGKAWHHVLDPRTQLPAETDLMAASVAASTGSEADVLASSAIILGREAAEKFLRQQKIKSALLINKRARAHFFGKIRPKELAHA